MKYRNVELIPGILRSRCVDTVTALAVFVEEFLRDFTSKRDEVGCLPTCLRPLANFARLPPEWSEVSSRHKHLLVKCFFLCT